MRVVLASAMVDGFRTGSGAALKGYSDECAQRVWRADRFSWFMTNLLHEDRLGDPSSTASASPTSATS